MVFYRFDDDLFMMQTKLWADSKITAFFKRLLNFKSGALENTGRALTVSYDLEPIVKEIVAAFFEKLDFKDERYRQFCREDCNVRVIGKNEVMIEQPLAMGVQNGQWAYGLGAKIKTYVEIQNEKYLHIRRERIEVLPFGHYIDPVSYSERYLPHITGSFPIKSRSQLKAKLAEGLTPLLTSNIKAQLANLIINNNDAESD